MVLKLDTRDGARGRHKGWRRCCVVSDQIAGVEITSSIDWNLKEYQNSTTATPSTFFFNKTNAFWSTPADVKEGNKNTVKWPKHYQKQPRPLHSFNRYPYTLLPRHKSSFDIRCICCLWGSSKEGGLCSRREQLEPSEAGMPHQGQQAGSGPTLYRKATLSMLLLQERPKTNWGDSENKAPVSIALLLMSSWFICEYNFPSSSLGAHFSL